MVVLHADGSVALTHGGIEMGQSLHTKLQQICANSLGVPFESIYTIGNTSTSTPNSPATGGSFGTDIHGPAVIDACKQILKKLDPFMKNGESITQAVGIATKMGIDLVAFSKYNIPPWGWQNPFTAHDFLYFTWNGAVTEAEVDLLTGEQTILQVDIIQDVGRSLNPTVDIGQIEGGFVQGFSWLTIEDLESTYNSKGQTCVNVESYEIAGLKNMPINFNVSLFKGFNAHNPDAPFGSKGIGEPPYCLGICGALAIRQAIIEARKENGLNPWVTINYPVTVGRTVIATELNLTK